MSRSSGFRDHTWEMEPRRWLSAPTTKDQQPKTDDAVTFVIPLSQSYNRNLLMATPTVYSVETAGPRTRTWRVLGAVLAGLVVIVVVGVGWFLSIARSALPELDGPLPVVGVSAPVSVTRDSHWIGWRSLASRLAYDYSLRARAGWPASGPLAHPRVHAPRFARSAERVR